MHLHIQHGVGRETYRVYFPKYLLQLRCLVEGCLGWALRQTNLNIHFVHRHIRDTVLILEEGNRPYPRCSQCDMFVVQKALNGRHLTTDFCRWGMERKWCCLAEEGTWLGTETALTAYGLPFPQVASFKYLGRVLTEEDGNWPAVVRNLQCARQKWTQLTRIFSREGVYALTLGQIYLAVL